MNPSGKLDGDIVVKELQSQTFVHFRTDKKDMNPLIPPATG